MAAPDLTEIESCLDATWVKLIFFQDAEVLGSQSSTHFEK